MSDQTNSSSVFADQIVVKFQNNQNNNNYCYSRQTPPSRAAGDGVDDVIRKPPPIAQLQNELKSWRGRGRDTVPPGRTWRTVLWNYSQATTFHGLVHVTATQPFLVRRFVLFAFFVHF